MKDIPAPTCEEINKARMEAEVYLLNSALPALTGRCLRYCRRQGFIKRALWRARTWNLFPWLSERGETSCHRGNSAGIHSLGAVSVLLLYPKSVCSLQLARYSNSGKIKILLAVTDKRQIVCSVCVEYGSSTWIKTMTGIPPVSDNMTVYYPIPEYLKIRDYYPGSCFI